MSGSGGGSGGSIPELVKDCDSISFNTDVNSPQKDVIEGLKVQDRLNVVLSNNKVVVKRDTGDILGSVNWSSITRLIECLHDGFEFVAVVRDIQDGLIRVHVSAK